MTTLNIKEPNDLDQKILFGQSPEISEGNFGQSIQADNKESRIKIFTRSLREMIKTYFPKDNMFLQRFVISYHNPYKSVWDVIILVFIYYSCVTTSYYVAFSLPTSMTWITIDNVVETGFAIDIILRFFHEYRDSENFEYIDDIRMITKHYIKGWFLIDFLAVFPFSLLIVNQNVTWVKLVRLSRLPRFLRLLDMSRLELLLESIFEKYNIKTKVIYLYYIRYVYKVIRLLLIAATLAYFIGCLWYYVANNQVVDSGEKTFIQYYKLDAFDNYRKMVICCYYTLTTLATVGYGDYIPQTDVEKIFGILIMILGIALFSYVMGSFSDVLTNYDKQMGIINKNPVLQSWMANLTKFRVHDPIPKDLVKKIDNHFNYFWKNDRLVALTDNAKYFEGISYENKYKIIRYLFDDIFDLFKGFLLTNECSNNDYNSQFLYDIAFELQPRKYDPEEMILHQRDIVHEIYLIKEGAVQINFEYEGQKIGKNIYKGRYFGNYNILHNVRSEFNYKAIRLPNGEPEVKIYAISKQRFLKILKNYPEIYQKMIENSLLEQHFFYNSMKHQLKLKFINQNIKITPNQLNKIFEEEILLKHNNIKNSKQQIIPKKKINKLEKELDHTYQHLADLIHNMASFNKGINEDLDYVMGKLYKVRNDIIKDQK